MKHLEVGGAERPIY